MARPRDFDERAVLSSAMRVFRALGFAGTSVRDLESATGLTTGSLYNGFGGKSGLFERALAHYNETVVLARLRRHLCHQRSPREELEALFRSTFEGKEADGLGCLLTNTSIEAQALSETAKLLLKSGVEAQRAAFVEVMGRVTPALSERARVERAEVLLAAYHGILVMVRQGQPRSALRSMAAAVFNLVF